MIGPESPLNVAPYQTELLLPVFTDPIIAQLGATKLDFDKSGTYFLKAFCLTLYTNLSSLAISPYKERPALANLYPALLRAGPITLN